MKSGTQVASSLFSKPHRRDWLKLATASSVGCWVSARGLAPNALGQEMEIPDPEPLTLTTKDFVSLRITYFGGLYGKKSIPIILVHDLNGRRSEFNTFARYLQTQRGYAVVAVDLRGHGESTRQKLANGTERTLSPEELKPADFANMVNFDLETVKKFLVERNNSEELNVAQTGIIAAGTLGSVVAMNWVQLDWSWPTVGSIKQGKDVQGMVLLSPGLNFKTLKTAEAVKIIGGLPMMLCGGRNEGDLRKLQTALKPKHPEGAVDPANAEKQHTLWVALEDTELRGTGLFKQGVQLAPKILKFLEFRFFNRADEYAWTERKKPVGN